MSPINMQPIPRTLAPFFQECEFSKLNPQKDSFTIIERVLQFGNRAEIRWLFTAYSQDEVTKWVNCFGKDRLHQPHRTFWQVVLETAE